MAVVVFQSTDGTIPKSYIEYRLNGAFERLEFKEEKIFSLSHRLEVFQSMALIDRVFKFYPVFYTFSVSAEDGDIYLMWEEEDAQTAFDLGFSECGIFDLCITKRNGSSDKVLTKDLNLIVKYFFEFVLDTYGI